MQNARAKIDEVFMTLQASMECPCEVIAKINGVNAGPFLPTYRMMRIVLERDPGKWSAQSSRRSAMVQCLVYGDGVPV